MSPDDRSTGISLDFIVGERDIPVPVLNGILSSLQHTIYIVGAYDTGRTQLRGASRQRYTLAIASIHHSNLHIDLVPTAQIAIEQLSLFGQVGINVASSAVYDAAKFGIARLKAHFEGQHPRASLAPEEPQFTPETLRDQALWQEACRTANEIAKLGGDVQTELQTPDGSRITYIATRSSAARIIEAEAALRGQAQKFRNCEVRKITIPGPALHARVPVYGNVEVRCVCDAQQTTIIETQVQLYRKYTIVGMPVWVRGKPREGKPSKIEVITLEDQQGNIILVSALDSLDKQTEDINLTGQGLFNIDQEDAS